MEERKIGEIFEYGGEWYQCVKGTECYECAFAEKHCNENPLYEAIGSCSKYYRKDNTSIIFKKLEKVGEPIIYMNRTFQKLKSLDNNKCKDCYFSNQVCNPQLCGEELFLVEIKKVIEDMGEKKLKPFDLEAAKQGKPVCTRDGRKDRLNPDYIATIKIEWEE